MLLNTYPWHFPSFFAVLLSALRHIHFPEPQLSIFLFQMVHLKILFLAVPPGAFLFPEVVPVSPAAVPHFLPVPDIPVSVPPEAF